MSKIVTFHRNDLNMTVRQTPNVVPCHTGIFERVVRVFFLFRWSLANFLDICVMTR